MMIGGWKQVYWNRTTREKKREAGWDGERGGELDR